MKRYKVILITLLIAIFIYQVTYRGKGFYEYPYEEYDLYRLPLIEPYAIYCMPNYKIWVTSKNYSKMDFECKIMEYKNGIRELQYIDSIGVNNNLILFHCLSFDGAHKDSHWLVFDIKKEKGECFISENDLNAFLRKLNSEIKLYNPEVIFQDFLKEGKLPPEWDEFLKKDHKKHWWIIKYWFE